MASVQESIEVDVPVSTAYNQWTQFETFPQFMKGVEAVEQIDETSLQFRTDIAGVRREFMAQTTKQTPDSSIAWVSTELEWDPEGVMENAGSAVGADSRQVSADLGRFKDFIESRGIETGEWRSSVERGEVHDVVPVDPSTGDPT